MYARCWFEMFEMFYAFSAASTQKNKTVSHSMRDLCAEFQSTLTLECCLV